MGEDWAPGCKVGGPGEGGSTESGPGGARRLGGTRHARTCAPPAYDGPGPDGRLGLVVALHVPVLGGDWLGATLQQADIRTGAAAWPPFFDSAFLWTVLMCGTHHLISQAGWKRCNLNLL